MLSRQACNQRLRENRHTELVREVIPLCYKIGAVVQRKESICWIRLAERSSATDLTGRLEAAIIFFHHDRLSFHRHQC